MSKRSKRKKQERKRYSAYITHSRKEMPIRQDYRAWPIVRAFVPDEDVFRATGCGTAGIVRERPDGMWITAFFTIEMINGGLRGAFGIDELAPDAADQFLEPMQFKIPAWAPGSADLAARYIWGSYSYAWHAGHEWPEEMKKRYLQMVPSLGGTKNWWLQQFVGPDGLVPPRLIEVCEENTTDEELPEGKEIVVFTTSTFDLPDREQSIETLHQHSPEFICTAEEDGSVWFDWSREYPKNHWSPLRLLGGRQSLGTVQITPSNTLIAECKVLSMAAILIAKLKNNLGQGLRLRHTEWNGVADLMNAGDSVDDDVEP